MSSGQWSVVSGQPAKPTDGNRWVFCFPLARESGPFRRRCPAAHFAILGVGPRAATRLPDAAGVVIAGYAGGLRDGWSVGEVIVASEVVDASGTIRPLHIPDAFANARRGRLLTWPHIVATPAEKRALGDRFDADAVDMETAAVAAACAGRGVPCVAVRVISDGVGVAMPPDVAQLITGGRISVAATIAALVRRPMLLQDLLRLNAATNFAGRELAAVLQLVTEDAVR